MIASCGTDIKFNQWSSGAIVAEFNPVQSSNEFKYLSWCNEGKYLAALPSGGRPFILAPHLEDHLDNDLDNINDYDVIDIPRVSSLNFSKTKSSLVCLGTKSGEVIVYDIELKKITRRMKKLPDEVRYVNYTAMDLSIVAGCKDSKIYIYDSKGKLTATFYVPRSKTLSAVMSHPIEAHTVAAGSKEGYVAVWDSNVLDTKFLTKDHVRGPCDLDFSNGHDLLGTIGFDRMLYLYDLRTKEHIFEKVFVHTLTAFAFKPIDKHFVLGSLQGELIYFDIRKLTVPLTTCHSHNSRIRKIAFQTQNVAEEDSQLKLIETSEDEVCELPTISSTVFPKASGDFQTVIENPFFFQRIPAGMDPSPSETSIVPTNQSDEAPASREYFLPSNTSGSTNNLDDLRTELLNATKQVMQGIDENFNNEFLKARMGISRRFCMIENCNNKGWRDFKLALRRLAVMEDKTISLTRELGTTASLRRNSDESLSTKSSTQKK